MLSHDKLFRKSNRISYDLSYHINDYNTITVELIIDYTYHISCTNGKSGEKIVVSSV